MTSPPLDGRIPVEGGLRGGAKERVASWTVWFAHP